MENLTQLLQLLQTGTIDKSQFNSVLDIIKKEQALKDKELTLKEKQITQSARPAHKPLPPIPHKLPIKRGVAPYKKSNNRVSKPADPNVFKQMEQKRYDELKKLEMADKINKQNQMIKKMALELKNSQINENITKKKTALMLPLNNLNVQSRVQIRKLSTDLDNFMALPIEWITDYEPVQSRNTILSPEEIKELVKIIEKKYNNYDYQVLAILPAT